MIIIPNLATVVILPPRTGSTYLWKHIKQRHEDAIFLYRHMEASGIPAGYEGWQIVGLCRHPTERLWSLYNYLKMITWDDPYGKAMRRSVDTDFNKWILTNEEIFTNPSYRDPGDCRYPLYFCNHLIPETKKSQKLYLRPDLGTKVFSYHGQYSLLCEMLDIVIDDEKINGSNSPAMPLLNRAATSHMLNHFIWDFENC